MSRPDPNHQPALDGLRALAVLGVIAFAFNLRWVPFHQAGYLGVDVFFVLSGFLITSDLVQGQGQGQGQGLRRISLRPFYARLARRLLPLAGVLLAVGTVVYVATPPSFYGRPTGAGLLSAAVGGSNWLRLRHPRALGVLDHTWPLAIGAQFALVWPPLLALVAVRRIKPRTVVCGLVVAIGAAVAWRAYLGGQLPAALSANRPAVDRWVNGLVRGRAWDRWYFNSFARADSLFLGCVVALVLCQPKVGVWLQRRGRSSSLGAVVVGGVTAVGVLALSTRPGFPRFLPAWGLPAFEASVALVIASVVVWPSNPVTSLLAAPPMVWIGRRAYSLYIIHWPMLILVHHLDVRPQSEVRLIATFAMAAVTYRHVEEPMLHRETASARRRGKA